MSLLLQLSKPAAAGKQVAPPSNSLLHHIPGGVTTNHAMERSNHMAYMTDSASDLDMSPGPEEVKSYHHAPPQTTYASCFGLPYQDHNYGAPPPPTPPASPPPPIVQPTPTSLMPLSNSSGKMNGHIDVEDISGITEITTTEYRDAVAAPAETMDDSITRCVCDFQHDDGYMICCDRCSVWQHVDCMGVDRNNIPENYMCELCDPRRVDKQRAVQIQTRKRRELAHLLDTSATESENETKALGIDPTTGKKIKGKKKRERDKLFLKDKKNKKLVKKLREKKEKLKQKQNRLQLSKKSKFGPGRRTFKRNNKIAPLPPMSLPLPIKDDVKDPYAWESSPVESFEEARINQYSSDVLGILASRKFNGQHISDASPREQLRVQLCHVSQISMTTKGLEAAEDLSCDRPLIEYKGKVMLREQYDKENVFFKHCHPFVLFYSKFEELDLCVDASSYGNDARYVRRSCTPNAEVRHYIENGKLHFYICSLKSICNGAEITIPFDYNYQDCSFAVECACTKSSCPITRFHRKVDMSSSQSNKIKKRRISSKSEVRSPPLPSISSNDEGPKSPTPKSPVRSPPSQSINKRRKLAPLSPIRTNNKKNQQQNNENTPAARRRTLSGPKSPASSHHAAAVSPKKGDVKSPGSHNQNATKTDTESSPEQSEPQRKLSREERKMEAIMKAFQKMEEREHRRQEALHRQDSTPISPPPGLAKPAPRTKSGKSKSTEESKKPENKDAKDLLKMEPVVVIESTTTSMNGEVQVRGPTLRSSTMPRTKAASKAMPPQIAAMEAAEAAAAAAAAAALAASKPQEPSQVQSACSEVKVKEDGEDKYEPPKTRKGKRKRMSSGPARRKSRMSSSASAASSTVDPFSSADESSNHATLSQPPSEATTPTPMGGNKSFQFPKTKKHLMKEWLYEKGHEVTKPLSIKTESLDMDGNVGSISTEEDSVEFVHCLPSPSTNALSHLRRSSMSNCSYTRDAASNAVTNNMGSSMGSAKKRWLRKAMFETKQPGTTESMSPVPSGSASPNPHSCSNSPGGSPPVANDFVTPLKKRRMARASMCAELPSFTSAPATPVPESPLVVEHRSASVGGETSNLEPTDFTIPLLNAASLQRSEGDVPNKLPNGFRPPPHHFSSSSTGSSTDNLFERITGPEKVDPEVIKEESVNDNTTSESVNLSRDASLAEPEPSVGVSEVKLEPMKEEPSVSLTTVETSPAKETSSQWESKQFPIKAEPESSVNSTAQSCLLTSSPLRGESSSAASSCASTLSPVRANTNCRSIVHTAATGSSPVKSETHSPSGDKDQVDSSVDSSHAEMEGVEEEDRTRHHSSSSSNHSHSHHYHNHQNINVLIKPNCEVPTCSTVGSDSEEIDSTREEGELDSSFARVTIGAHHDFTGADSDMDTQVDVVSHSEPCEREARHTSSDIMNQENTPEEQQGISTASQSQGFEVRLNVEGQEDQSSSQVDSSEGSIMNRDHHLGVADSGQTSRSRHQSAAESVCSSRSRHQSAADSVSEHLEELSRPDSGQELNSVYSRSVEGPERGEEPQQSSSAVLDEVEEGEVSEGDEEHVGSSGTAQQREEEIEEGEIIDDSDEERTTVDSPTSSSTNTTSQPSDSRVTEAGQAAAKDDQAVSCSTDSGVEVSSGEDLNHSSESVSDGEAVQSSGITASSDPKLRRTSSQNQISSSDHTSSQTLSAVSAGISSDTGALPTCSSTDNLVGSSNRTAGLFSSRLSSSSLTSSSSLEQKEGSSDTEVDSTSSHKQTINRGGIHASRSPADVSSSSSLNQDASTRSTFGTFTSRWQSVNTTGSSVDPIPEEPSSSENHASCSELPHASTTFLSSSASSSSHPSSTTSTSPAPQSKKKVSLLEYRKRMKSRSVDENNSSKFSERSSSLPTLPNTTLGAHLRNLRDSLVNKTPSSTVTKTIASSSSSGDLRRKDDKRPLSGRSTPSSSSGSSSGGRLTPSLPSLPLFSQKADKSSGGKDEADVRWSINPTAAERLCEHANVSLTERLRRDFGIDATESDEEDGDERGRHSSGGESPPPPPPPPPPPKPAGSETKVQQQNPVVYMPHHTLNMPVGVQIPQATAGLPGGQMPLPPPPKPPLNLQQPPAGSLVPQGVPQPLPPQPLPTLPNTVPNNTAKSGHIPSLMSLPLGPTKFSQNRVGGNQYDCDDDQVEDVPPPPPPPLALQGFIQQQPPATTSFPKHPSNMAPTQPAPAQTFISGNQANTQTSVYPVSIPGAGPDPSLQQYNYQPGAQPHGSAAGPPASAAYNSPPSKGKSSKKSFQQPGYSGKKYKHH